ncbi:hypothetical protein [Polaromonas sp.]|uniref:hypothetical protein n=1 Tax=Polaromonas sp. TaxID=1869339 RepID=UPI003264B8B4
MSNAAMPARTLPVALGPDLSASLQFMLRTTAESGQHNALREALGDPKVQALVVVLPLSESPAATWAACLSQPDSLGQWLGLSCI